MKIHKKKIFLNPRLLMEFPRELLEEFREDIPLNLKNLSTEWQKIRQTEPSI